MFTTDGYCPTHAVHVRRIARRETDAQRGNSAARGYDARWRKARLIHLAHHPRCVGFGATRGKCLQPASVVDHVVPHRGDHTLFWDAENWQSLCASCHNSKTATEDGGFGHTQTYPTPPPHGGGGSKSL